MIPYELLQGLNRLACKSKDKRIEDLFIKLANQSESNFSNWVIKNQNNSVISNEIGDSQVISALAYMYKNKENPPEKGWVYHMVEKHKQWLPIYGAFFRLLQSGNQDMRTIFGPLQTILPLFSNFVENDWMPDEKVKKNIYELINSFNRQEVNFDDDYHPVIKKRMTREEKRQEKAKLYFDFFFEHLSKEIYSSIGQLSNPEHFKDLGDLIEAYRLPETHMIIPFLNYRFDNSDKVEVEKVVNSTLRTILSPRFKGQPYHALEYFRANAMKDLGSISMYEYQYMIDRSSDTPKDGYTPFMDKDVDLYHENEEKEEEKEEPELYKFEASRSVLPKYVFASSVVLRELYRVGMGR